MSMELRPLAVELLGRDSSIWLQISMIYGTIASKRFAISFSKEILNLLKKDSSGT